VKNDYEARAPTHHRPRSGHELPRLNAGGSATAGLDRLGAQRGR